MRRATVSPATWAVRHRPRNSRPRSSGICDDSSMKPIALAGIAAASACNILAGVLTRGGGMRKNSAVPVHVVGFAVARLAIAGLIVVGFTGSRQLWAQDWPQWRGPNRDG